MNDKLLVLPSSSSVATVNTGQCAEQAARFWRASGVVFRKGDKILRLEGDHLVVVTPEMAQTLLFEEMTVMVWNGKGEKSKLEPAPEIGFATLKAILGGHHVGRHIPQITVVAQRAFLVLVGGQLVALKKGYNPERGGILVLGDEVLPDVPVEEAVTAISSLFADFHFATPSDRSRAIAAVLCAAMRIAGIYERHPLLVFEADLSQAGKGLMWAMLCAIFGQRYGNVAPKKGGVGSLDESIMERLVEGKGFILLDNIRGKVASAFLESCLTAENGDYHARIPNKGDIPVDPRPVVFGLTSNAAELTTDMANRSMMVRIRKQPGNYTFRQWTDAEGNEVGIRKHIESRQAFYQGCVNAILRDWWGTGAKLLPCVDHSFKDTIGALDFMVQTYFGLPPLLDGHQEALERTTRPGMSWLRQIALLAADKWGVVGWSASRIVEKCLHEGVGLPGETGEVEPQAAAKQVGIAMASAFGGSDSVTVDGILVTRATEKDSEGRERKTYSFSRGAA